MLLLMVKPVFFVNLKIQKKSLALLPRYLRTKPYARSLESRHESEYLQVLLGNMLHTGYSLYWLKGNLPEQSHTVSTHPNEHSST